MKALINDDDGSMIQAKEDVSVVASEQEPEGSPEEDVSIVASEQEPEGSPEVTAVAHISPSTLPKDTSSNIYEKPMNETINTNEPGTQLFNGSQSDSE